MSRFDKYIVNPPQEEAAPVQSRFDKYLARPVPEPSPEIQGDDMGAGKAFGIAISGEQIPFANRLTSAMGATIAKAASPISGDERTWGELYDQAQADTRTTQEANPKATLAGNVAGIASTLPLAMNKAIFGAVPTQGARGVINAIPQGIAKVDTFVRGGKAAKSAGTLAKAGSLALRSAKGAVVAAPMGALYGAGDSENMLEGAKRGAAVAASVGAALPAVGAVAGAALDGTKTAIKGMKARDAESLVEAARGIKDSSGRAYQRMRQAGATFSNNTANKIANELEQTLINDGPLVPAMHGKSLGVLQQFKERAAQGNFSLEEVDKWRQLFADVAGNYNDRDNGRKATLMINKLDELIDNVGAGDLAKGTPEAIDALKLGRSEYKRARKFEAITDILNKADGDPNKIKASLKRFLDNKKNTRGWSAEEIIALNNAAKYTAPEGIIKAVGKLGFDLGTSQTMGNTLIPIISGVATMGKAPAIGTAARQTQKYLARGKAEDLLKIIESGGQVSQRQIMALPPAQAKIVLKAMRPQGSFSRAAILEQSK